MSKVDMVMELIKKLPVSDLIELKRKVAELPPGPELAPVGAKPKPPAPSLSGSARKSRR